MNFRSLLSLSGLALVVLLIFSGCAEKEVVQPDEALAFKNKENFLKKTIEEAPPSGANKLNFPCPEPEDYCCSDIYTTLDYFTGAGNFGQSTTGRLDKLLNCPYQALEYCERQCPSQTIIHGYNLGADWIAYWSMNGDPCAPTGYFTAQAQQALIDYIHQISDTYAPLCNNRPMEAISYNVFWDTISFTTFYIGVEITYISPCQFTLEPG